MKRAILLLPDAGPLITLAYAHALDLLLIPGWTVKVVDMVVHELTRQTTPTVQSISSWLESNPVEVLPTDIFTHYQGQLQAGGQAPKRSNLGEFAIQEIMNRLAVQAPERVGLFLFEDHKIASAQFLIPAQCQKISTRSFLIFLEQRGLIPSAAEVVRAAIHQGRQFSQLRFPA